MKVVILGRELGTASGWDDMGDQEVAFYDFNPFNHIASKTGLAAIGTLFFNAETGRIGYYDDEGAEYLAGDAIELLHGVECAV